MTAVELATAVPVEPKRDRFGRYLIEGKPYTRATTVAGTLEDTYNLSRWQMRQTAYGLVLRDDLLAQAQAHHPDGDKKLYNKVCQAALDAAAADRKANLGTALHRFTEDLDAGRKTLDEIPEPHRAMCHRYQTILDVHGVTVERDHIEQIVTVAGHNIAGTIDRIVRLADGSRVVGDLKTSTTLNWSWLKIGVQLAIYANHTNTYDPATDKLGPPIEDIDLDRALVIHLPSNGDGAALHLVDIRASAEAWMTAMEARGYRTDAKKWATIYNPPVTPYAGETALRDWLADRIRIVSDTGPTAVADLRNRWPEQVPTPLPATPTNQQVDALDRVLTRVEARHEIPFGHSRPGATKQPSKEQAT